MISKSRRQALKLLASGMAILTIPFNPTFADEVPTEQPIPYTIDQHMANVSEILGNRVLEAIRKMHGEFNSPEIRSLINTAIMEYGHELIRVRAIDHFSCICMADDDDVIVDLRYEYQGNKRSIRISAKRGFAEVIEF